MFFLAVGEDAAPREVRLFSPAPLGTCELEFACRIFFSQKANDMQILAYFWQRLQPERWDGGLASAEGCDRMLWKNVMEGHYGKPTNWWNDFLV